MKFQVMMLAFHGDNTIREVFIPDQELKGKEQNDILNKIYHYGQNEAQPVDGKCSVSVGDVIKLNDKKFIVQPFGFSEISNDDLEKYKKIPRQDRSWSQYARPI